MGENIMSQRAKFITSLAAILAIFILEAIAIIKGLNGVLLAGAIGALAGLGGFSASQIIKSKRP